jgi:hypothetical protein
MNQDLSPTFFLNNLEVSEIVRIFANENERKFVPMNTNVLPAPSIDSARYWNELKGLSNKVKLELITLLSSSMTIEKTEEKSNHWADRFCGAWKDNRTADEIVDNIRSMRTTNHVDVEL